MILGVARRDIARLIKGQNRPTQEPTFSGKAWAASDKAIAEFNRAEDDLYAILYLLTDKPAALLVAKHKDIIGTSGNGQQALFELVSKYKVTDEVIRSTIDILVNTPIKEGEDPDDYFMEKTLGRAELAKMDETITDRSFEDICVQGFTSEYKDVKMMMYRDPTFDIHQMQSTMRHLYLDDISHNNDAKITGSGVAMTATSICSHSGKQGYYARNCC